jgi:hypothetical protein
VPKLTRKPPKLTHHVLSGRARVRYRGKDLYLGAHGSPESYQCYAEILARLSAGTLEAAPADEPKGVPVAPAALVMAELIERFDAHYRPDGVPTGEHVTFRCALRPILTLYPTLPVVEFSPRQLMAVRDEMIRLKWSRRHIRASVRRVQQMFRWAVAQELVAPTIASALNAVEALKEGRSDAREKDFRR